MAADEGQAVCLPRRCSRYGSWSIACSRLFLPGLRGGCLLSYQGCSQALDHGPVPGSTTPGSWRHPDGNTLPKVTCVRRTARPVGYGHSTGPGTGDRTCPAGQSGHDHRSARRRRGWPCPDRARDQFLIPAQRQK